jgi:hypothetical protein
VLFNQHSSQALSSTGSNSIVAVAFSNHSAVPWLPGSYEHNPLPTGTFEWTNGSRSTSGIGSHSVTSGTN